MVPLLTPLLAFPSSLCGLVHTRDCAQGNRPDNGPKGYSSQTWRSWMASLQLETRRPVYMGKCSLPHPLNE